jgi:RNA polymerase sigma-70 factor (ECF subfamily)
MRPDSRITPTASDAELVLRMRAGDARAFEIIFRKYYDSLCHAIASYLGDRDAVEDVVQDVFARMWEGRDRLQFPDESLTAYLQASVRRRAISQIRREVVRRKAVPLLVLETGEQQAPSEGSFDTDALLHRFARAVAALPPRTREAFMLSRREGLSYDEIALRMGISIKTVGVHIGNSLTALRRVIGTK